MTRHAVAVGEDRDLTTRLDLERGDEIGVLAREFDRMVERVAESRTQLVDQSYQAGFAELAKGVLHNLGNAMTPIGVRLAKLAERLREYARARMRAQAAAELQRAATTASAVATCDEFLRLACRELASHHPRRAGGRGRGARARPASSRARSPSRCARRATST